MDPCQEEVDPFLVEACLEEVHSLDQREDAHRVVDHVEALAFQVVEVPSCQEVEDHAFLEGVVLGGL